MADEKDELKMINHLLDVEKEANVLISQAMEEAAKKTSEARARFNEEYKQKIDAIIEELKNKYEASVKEVSDDHANQILKFEKSLDAKEEHYGDFKQLLDRLLLEKN